MNTKSISEQHKKQLEEIGHYLKNLRLDESLSQLELSEHLSLHQNTIQRIEVGSNATLLTIFELADFYGLQPSELMSILD